jgi:MYXO-CTERM domain-containing protein
MGSLIRFIFTPLGIMLVGLIAVGAGGYMYWDGTHDKLPERAELTVLNGNVTKATKITRTKRGVTTGVTYELLITPKDKEAVTLRIDESRITETQASVIVHEPVVVLLRDNRPGDVWELSYGGQAIIAYAKTRAEKEATLAWEVANAPYAGGGGLAALFVGGLWMKRRRDDA